MDVVEAVGGDPLIDDAARIWAEATAARDGHGEVARLDAARPVIQAVLDRSPRAFLLIARSAAGTAGFAAMEPLAGRGGVVAQVSYIGVRPGLWGRGVGARLLQEVSRQLTATGYASVELSVYVDYRRAAALYERLGWQPRGEPAAHPGTGKPEQRYELRL
jgi:ribosomal protein S18 acetylase RimI-like enzyme